MTLTTDTQNRFTLGEVVKMAYQKLGVLDGGREPSTSDQQNGLLWMRSLLSEMPLHGVQARAMTLHDLTMVAEQVTPYSFPGAALDVFGYATYIGPNDSAAAPENQLIVKQVTRERYLTLPDQAALGVPSLYYIDRQAFPLTVSFWPWPHEAGTVRFQAHRPHSEPLASSDVIDIEQWWVTYLASRLAELLAPSKGVPIAERALMSQESMRLLRLARGKSNERPDSQLVVRGGR